jgi:hypothetical protein
MVVKTIFVSSNLEAWLPCSECGQTYQKDVSKFMGHHTKVRLKYTCKCKHRFSVILERRRFVRKNLLLKGYLIEGNQKIPITVQDLSRTGIKIKVASKMRHNIGDIIQIQFRLDNKSRSEISRAVRIKRVVPPTEFGCEFTQEEHYDDLGKYFLFDF